MGIEQELKQVARGLLEREQVKCLIGYERGSDYVHTTPCFIKHKDEADRLIWNPFCTANLTKHLLESIDSTGKVGVVVKGCDARSLIELMKQNQVERDKIFVLGIPCAGIIDPVKLGQVAEVAEIEGVEDSDDRFVVVTGGARKEVEKESLVRDKCLTCRYPVAFRYDAALGDMVSPAFADAESFKDIQELEELSLEERARYWESHLSQCIRCFACKDICPLCFCPECIFDRKVPRWIQRATRLSENQAYHLIRAFHLAGRCVDCGECERACPVDIPLRKLNRKLSQAIQILFGYEGAGMRADEPPPLTTFDLEDPDPSL